MPPLHPRIVSALRRAAWACAWLGLLGVAACQHRRASARNVAVSVELFAVTVDHAELRYWRGSQRLLRRSGSPEDTVRALLTQHAHGAVSAPQAASFLHSTSWRYETPGEIVLTYLAYVPPSSAALTGARHFPVANLPTPAPTDPLHPRPPHIAELDVLAHGLRHLAFLIKREPNGSVALAVDPAGRQVLTQLAPEVAGQF